MKIKVMAAVLRLALAGIGWWLFGGQPHGQLGLVYVTQAQNQVPSGCEAVASLSCGAVANFARRLDHARDDQCQDELGQPLGQPRQQAPRT